LETFYFYLIQINITLSGVAKSSQWGIYGGDLGEFFNIITF